MTALGEKITKKKLLSTINILQLLFNWFLNIYILGPSGSSFIEPMDLRRFRLPLRFPTELALLADLKQKTKTKHSSLDFEKLTHTISKKIKPYFCFFLSLTEQFTVKMYFDYHV